MWTALAKRVSSLLPISRSCNCSGFCHGLECKDYREIARRKDRRDENELLEDTGERGRVKPGIKCSHVLSSGMPPAARRVDAKSEDKRVAIGPNSVGANDINSHAANSRHNRTIFITSGHYSEY